MRVMVMVRANKDTEAGVMPSEKMLADMTKFNEELAEAGVMLAGEGLKPSSKGARIQFTGGKRNVVDGPFAEAKELIAGYWLWEVKSLDEAIQWAKRAPMEEGATLEIRPFFEAEDFGKEFTPELREREEKLRKQLEAKQ
ncbi:MAG: YciI family protein [Candidatus Eisenbacteria bacterium]|nr:YciI family protein [Candidatus Eisenbacteria bacterium]